jgi:hypothetical protein
VDEPCLFSLKDSPTLLYPSLYLRDDFLLDSPSVLLSTWSSYLGIEVIHKANSASLSVYIYLYQVYIIEDIEDWRQ